MSALHVKVGLFLAPLIAALAIGQSPASPQAHSQGLTLWRKPGAIDNHAACATCHSPDGIELAFYGFDDATILRRAHRHLSESDSRKLVAYFRDYRRRIRTTSNPNAFETSPLQPGGFVLPGKTPEDRDFAFGLQLQQKTPTLFGAPIKSLAQAIRAEHELLAVDVFKLRVGFPLSRLSEDPFHGPHAVFNQWLPEVAPTIPADKLAEWYRKSDAYLRESTTARLAGLITDHELWIPTARFTQFQALSAQKFRALLVLQHRLRTQVAAKSHPFLDPVVLELKNHNPVWEVGEIARDLLADPSPISARTFGLDEPDLAAHASSRPLADQVHSLRLSWFWLGWMLDQGLYRTSPNDKVRLGAWLAQSLSEDGPYALHLAFADGRRQAVINNNLASWAETLSRRHRLFDLTGLHSAGRYLTLIPRQPERRKLYLTFVCNLMRMNLLLEQEAMLKTREVWRKPNTRAAVAEFTDFIRKYEPGSVSEINAIQRSMNDLIDRGKERF